MGKPTAADMIAKVIELRDHIEALTTQFETGQGAQLYVRDGKGAFIPFTGIKQDRANIEFLENLLGMEIERLGGQSIKTACGTAFRSTTTSFRCADRQVWLDWVYENWDARCDMLATNVAKDAVKEHADQYGLPPGLNQTVIHKTLVRRPTNE